MAITSSAATSLRGVLARERGRSRALASWLASLPLEDGIRIASEPTHFGGQESGEESYAAQFTHDEQFERRMGQSLVRALGTGSTSAPALELGAGTGILSRPLVASTKYPAYFITDTSPEFLRRTRASIDRLGLGKRVEYLVLSGDELDRWPEGTLSLVALRYTLHHVLDWEHFIQIAGQLLVPGGSLAFEEPCADGFVLQAAMADVLRHSPALRRKMSSSVRRDLDFMVATTLFYARTDVDKSAAEDKHIFPVFRLLDVCRKAQLEPELYPNQGFDGGFDPTNPGYGTFAADFRHNLAVNFGFGAETLDFFDRHLAAACEDVVPIAPRGGGPVVRAVVVARKPPVDGSLVRASASVMRAISARVAPSSARPLDEPSTTAQTSQDGFQLTLDSPPSTAPAPRWGHGRKPHRELHGLIASHDATYRAELDLIAGYAPELCAIEASAADPREPSWINGFLPGLDGAALYAFLRTRAPRRYLEVGCASSSKFAARAKRDGRLETEIVSIGRQPRAEVEAFCDTAISRPLETDTLEAFAELEPGDVVFFDSSHRTFTNSDATVFFLDVLPTLPVGTLVGIHDVYLPDDYPRQWSDRYYSEQYLLAAYLIAGCRWLEPVLAAWYVSSHPELSGRLQSLWEDPRLAGVERHGGAFWMQINDRHRARG